MSNKSIRTPAQQEYRDNLAKKLHTLRWQWEDWKKLANDLYETLKDNSDYIKAEGKSRSFNRLFQDVEKSFNTKSDFMANALVLYKTLQKNKTELTERQKETVKKIIRFWFDKYEKEFFVRASGTIMDKYNGSLELLWKNVAVSFLRQNFNLFSQEEKEDFILKVVENRYFFQNSYYLEDSVMRWYMEWFPREYEIYDTDHLQPNGPWSNWTIYKFSSRNSIKSMVENTLANSNNEKFIVDILSHLKKDAKFFDIPKNAKGIMRTVLEKSKERKKLKR